MSDTLSEPINPVKGRDFVLMDAQSGNLTDLALEGANERPRLTGKILDDGEFTIDLTPYIGTRKADPESARERAAALNAEGFRLYQEKNYKEALAYFRKSFVRDSRYHYPRYNWACTASLLLEESYCEYMHLLDEIFHQLQFTVQLRPEYKEKMMTDPDLTARFSRGKIRFSDNVLPALTDDSDPCSA